MQWLAAFALALTACRPDPMAVENPFRTELLSVEAALSDAGPRYADPARADHFDPEGLYLEEDLLWVWSRAQPQQIGLRQGPGTALVRVAERSGPHATRRCVVGRDALQGTTFCIGEREPRGIRTFGGASFDPGLPARAGFRDLALDPQHGLVHVVDGMDDRLWTLDASGRSRGSVRIPGAAYAVGALDEVHLFVLSGVAPLLSILSLDADGLPDGRATGVPLVAPLRDAAWDAERRLLWTVGPEDTRVRRRDDRIRHLGSEVRAHALSSLLAGSAEPVLRFPLSQRGLVDGTHLVVTPRGIAVSATGSDALWRARWDGARWRTERVETGLGPQGLVPLGDGVAVASRLDDGVQIHPWQGVGARMALDASPRSSERDLGERLFFGRFLFGADPENAFTCNGCHWDAGTDHRLQPGFHEQRWEMTRPLGGIGAVAPIFSTLGAPSLTDAVEGLIRGLDERFAGGRRAGAAYWLQSVTVPIKGAEPVTLSAIAQRRALLQYLMTLPVAPGPLRAAGDSLPQEVVRGRALFTRDCLACHEASRDMRRRDRVPETRMLAELELRPLVFGAPLFARTGVLPYFGDAGNRVTPLRELGRGGPFFTDGSAATLTDALRRTRPGSELVHAPLEGEPAYSDAEIAALRAFLLWL